MSEERLVLVTENTGNVHDARISINERGLADYVLTIVGYEGGNSVVVFRVPESMVRDGNVVRQSGV